MNGVIDINNSMGTPNVYGRTLIGTEQQNLATYDPAIKRIRSMTPTERMRRKNATMPAVSTAPDAPDPDIQLHALQGAAMAQQADQQAGAFAGLQRRRR